MARAGNQINLTLDNYSLKAWMPDSIFLLVFAEGDNVRWGKTDSDIMNWKRIKERAASIHPGLQL